MNMPSIRHFRTELRLKIDALESDFDWLVWRIARGEASSEQLVRAQLERLNRQIARKRSLQSDSGLTTGGWSAHARSRACAAMEAASAAIDEAARAALEAWLAEKHAIPARSQPAPTTRLQARAGQ